MRIPVTYLRVASALLLTLGTCCSAAKPKAKLDTYVLGTSTTAPAGYTYTGDSIVAPTDPTLPLASPIIGSVLANANTATVIGDKLYWAPAGSTSDTSTPLLELDMQRNTWTTKASRPGVFSGGAMAVIDGKIHAVGGYAQSGIVNNHDVYDPATDIWTPAAPMQLPDYDTAAAVEDGILFVFGGLATGPDTRARSYDPLTDSWSNKISMPTPLGGNYLRAHTIGSDIYIITTIGTSLLIYHPHTDTYSTGATVPSNKMSALFGGKIYILDQFVYDPVIDTWQVVGTPGPAGTLSPFEIGVDSGIVGISSSLTYLWNPVRTKYYIHRKGK